MVKLKADEAGVLRKPFFVYMIFLLGITQVIFSLTDVSILF